ncbi:tetratricopeptide repeat protein [Sphingomonas sp.]|uniref:tetratricopeptide repeat protein n=1 Tax=Sphingomonas sp. TaxID=28214 RepID=UPI001ED0A867|nr:tetratricopeptide repeat protein [Sphingomonas sp.]MBX3593252.1 tetratricopeptide repeat protein [Sphingomonas sp.]
MAFLLALAMVAQAAPDAAERLEDAGRYREAEPLLRAALQRSGSRQDAAAADAAERLGDNLARQARPAEAEPFYRRALQIRLAVHGEGHPATARSYSQIAGLAADAGRLAEADALSRRACAILLASEGPQSPALARALGNRAGILARMGMMADAYELYRKSAEILQRAGPPLALDYAVALNNLAVHLQRMAAGDRVPAGFRRTFTMRQAVLSPPMQGLMAGLAGEEGIDPMLRRRLLADAAMAFRMALGIRIRLLGEMHPDTANSLNGLAASQRSLGDLAGAMQSYRRAYAIKVATLPPEDRDRVIGAWSLATVTETAGDAVQARALYREAAAGAIAAQARHRDFDSAATHELRSYAPIFRGQVRTAWALSRP